MHDGSAPLRTAPFLPVIGVLALTTAGPAQIRLDQNFDSGSLDVAATRIDYTRPLQPLVTLEPRRFAGSWSGDHWWVQFKASGIQGLTPRFRLPTAGAFQGYSNAHRWVFTATPALENSWRFFDHGSVSGGYFNFSNRAAFATPDVYIAYGIPFPVSRTAATTQALVHHPFVSPTRSANPSLVIGRTPGTAGGNYRDDLGRTVPAFDLYGYRISDPAAPGPKMTVVITTGNHSGEHSGTWTLQGFVDFVLGTTADAAELRRMAEIFVYPQSDPEGRHAGYFRSNPENPARNHNRFWDQPAGFSDVTIITGAMRHDTGGDVDFFFDFHSFGSATGIGYYRHSEGVLTSIFTARVRALEPLLREMSSTGGPSPGIASVWAASGTGLRAEVAITPETGFLANQPVSRYRTLGANYARAVLETIRNRPPPPLPRSETRFLERVGALAPALHLRLDETGGTRAADVSGRGHHGTYFGGVGLGQKDPFAETRSTAVRFSGTAQSPSGEYVRVDDFAYTNPKHEFTLAFWFRTGDISGTSLQYLFSHGPVVKRNSVNVYFIEDGHSSRLGGRLRTIFLDSNDPETFDNVMDVMTPLADGAWHLYTLVWSATQGAAIVYVDGREANRNQAIGGDPFDPATRLFLAAREDLDARRFYGRPGADNGLLDEMLIFDRALDAAAILDLYTATSLTASPRRLSVSRAGDQVFSLEAGASRAGRPYLLLGTLAGPWPGFRAGSCHVPLNVDPYFVFTALNPNQAPLSNATGTLDGQGKATARFTVLPALFAPLVGLTTHHAYGVTSAGGLAFTSNPVPLAFVR
jgi:hypothetical protein